MIASRLFEPIEVAGLPLKHRVVLAPLNRCRANAYFVPTDLMTQYYAQRASVPGTLLITESVNVAAEAGGRPHVPGLWSDEQVAGWKRITNAVHSKGSFIFAQLRAYGRAGDPEFLRRQEPSLGFVSSSNVPLSDGEIPRPLTSEEIHRYIGLYTQAAINAIEAGFDGVQIHAANGYLIDQFTSSRSNTRTDEWGGSIENRCRFALEIMDAIVGAIGAKRTAIRLSPWSDYLEVRMADPIPTYEYLVKQISERFPDLAFLDVLEPGINGTVEYSVISGESNDFIREIWAPRPIISAGGYTRESGIHTADRKGDLIAYGRLFIANPDLPTRLMRNLPLNTPDHSTFYSHEEPRGYIDYPTYEQSLAIKERSLEPDGVDDS